MPPGVIVRRRLSSTLLAEGVAADTMIFYASQPSPDRHVGLTHRRRTGHILPIRISSRLRSITASIRGTVSV